LKYSRELDKNNMCVKLASIIPWDEFEETYAKQFINNGRPSKPLRIVLESLIPITESYKARNGFYPERILADKSSELSSDLL
jgi:hypothetical protein